MFYLYIIILVILLLVSVIYFGSKDYFESKNKSFGFIITTHVNSEKTNKYWKNSVDCIRKYYDNKIIIINDNSNPEFTFENEYENVIIINSEYPGRGELLPYYYFYKNNFFDKAVIMHDSMFINKHIDFNIVNNAFFFNAGTLSENDQNVKNKLKVLNQGDSLVDYYENNQDKWFLCFGAQSVITYDFLKTITEKYNLFKLLDYIKNREDRMDFERIYGLLCNREINPSKIDVLYGSIYDLCSWGYTYEEYIEDKNNNRLTKDISKVWTGR